MKDIMDVYNQVKESVLDDEDAQVSNIRIDIKDVQRWFDSIQRPYAYWRSSEDVIQDEKNPMVFYSSKLGNSTDNISITDKTDIIPIPGGAIIHMRDSIRVEYNKVVKSLKGLPQYIDGVGRNLDIIYCEQLESLEGCPDVERGCITIDHCPKLMSLNGIGHCEKLRLGEIGKELTMNEIRKQTRGKCKKIVLL